jgi:hypothetical protein
MWFAMAIASTLIVCVTTQAYRRSSFGLTGRLLASKVSYKLFFKSKVTWLQAILLLVYLALSVVLMVLELGTLEERAIRLGTLAAINITLLFLGSRTSTLAELAGLLLQFYYIVHH